VSEQAVGTSAVADTSVSVADKLRSLLAGTVPAVAPGCYDAVTAGLIEAEGYQVAYVSGASVAALELGVPDLGLAGVSDILERAARVVEATRLPVIADADAGFGEAVHVAHTVRRYERCGLAGLHIEDQALPKRCGHMSGKVISPLVPAAARVRAAVRARTDLVIIARTDALSVHGLADVLQRVRAYAGEGADAIFVEGLTTLEEIAAVREAAGHLPLVVSLSEAGGEPRLRLCELSGIGVGLVIYPVSGLLAALYAYRQTLRTIRDSGGVRDVARMGWAELNDILGLGAMTIFEQANNN
jgi:2-methylisocitrate lyase-like PEP mutase family enzyme